MLMSAPVAYDNRVFTQSNNKRMVPAIRVEIPKIIAKGSKISPGYFIPSALITNCRLVFSKIRSGAANAARKGKTAPILKISAIEVTKININKK